MGLIKDDKRIFDIELDNDTLIVRKDLHKGSILYVDNNEVVVLPNRQIVKEDGYILDDDMMILYVNTSEIIGNNFSYDKYHGTYSFKIIDPGLFTQNIFIKDIYSKDMLGELIRSEVSNIFEDLLKCDVDNIYDSVSIKEFITDNKLDQRLLYHGIKLVTFYVKQEEKDIESIDGVCPYCGYNVNGLFCINCGKKV